MLIVTLGRNWARAESSDIKFEKTGQIPERGNK